MYWALVPLAVVGGVLYLVRALGKGARRVGKK